jgi:hypothetical protein
VHSGDRRLRQSITPHHFRVENVALIIVATAKRRGREIRGGNERSRRFRHGARGANRVRVSLRATRVQGGAMTSEIERDLESQIRMTHDRFVAAMSTRLPMMPLEQKERYFAVLSALAIKLESPTKSLREILQEMMAEAATYVLQEIH